MKKNLKSITKDEVNRIHFLKYEVKKRMIQSAIRGEKLNLIKKIFLKMHLINANKKEFINRRMNVCLLKGKHGGVYNKYGLCRHIMLKIATAGSLHNTRIVGW